MDAHACMFHSYQAHPRRLPPPLTHTAFQTTWLGHPDSPQHLYSPSRMHTPLPPPTLARTPELELLQSPPVAGPRRPLQRCVFSSRSHSLYCMLWELVSDAAAPAHYLFISSSSRPDPPVRRAAAQTETGRKLQGHRRQRTAGGPLRSPHPVH